MQGLRYWQNVETLIELLLIGKTVTSFILRFLNRPLDQNRNRYIERLGGRDMDIPSKTLLKTAYFKTCFKEKCDVQMNRIQCAKIRLQIRN